MKRYLPSILCVILAVLADQYTKFLAVKHLKEKSIPIIKDVFELHYLENRGAAFGMLQNQQWFFLILTICFLIIIGVIYCKLPHTKRIVPLRICMIFVVSGAIGNMIDRIRLNYVVDFLYFKWIDFPIFNVADIFVTVSTIAAAVLILFYYSEEEFDTFTKCLSLKRKENAGEQ